MWQAETNKVKDLEQEREEADLVRKITWRLIPLLCFLYFLSFLDRVNVANAHDSLLHDLKLNEKDYALAVGVFFVGYVLFEVPSNLLLVKTSPSRWIARIMVTWGIMCMLQVFITNKSGLVAIRFFFGIAEAGFTPGVTYFLTLWFTQKEQAGRMALFFSSTAVCGLFGGLLAFGILHMDGILGLHGWQWLFLLEGFPSVVAGVVVWFVLPNHPSECKWLNEKEQMLATSRLEGVEKGTNHTIRFSDVVATLREWRVLGCAFVYLTILTAFYSVSFFLPALMTDFGFSSLNANLMSTPVYFFAAIVMLANGYHSDKTQERMWHVLIPGGVGVAGWALLAFACAVRSLALELVAIFIVTACTWSLISPTLAWLMGGLQGATSSAVGAAFVIAFGNIGGIVGPYTLGASMDGTGNYSYGIAAVGGLLAIGMATLFFVQRHTNKAKGQKAYSAELYQDYIAD